MRLVLTTDTVGGVWTFTKELAGELLRRGHEVCLVSFGRDPSSAQQWAVAKLHEVYAGRFRFAWSDTPLEWMQSNTAAYDDGAALLLALDATFQPDAYIFSQFCFGALPVDVFKVVVAHSDVVSWAAACSEPLDEGSEWMRTYRSLVSNGLAAADALVSPTAAYLEALQGCFEDLPEVQSVIANGRTLPSPEERPRALQAVAAGRTWDKAKGLRLLDDCVLPMPVLIAGEGDAFGGNGGGPRWLGTLDEAQLVELFRESAVYVCTSLYEPFGLAPLEAGLCGCAVVARDLPSLREVWGDAAVYFHDAGSLMRVLAELHADAPLLREAQSRSQMRATQYTAARMTDGYLELLTTLMAEALRTEAYAA